MRPELTSEDNNISLSGPGYYLKSFLEDSGMRATTLAEILRIKPDDLDAVLREEQPLTKRNVAYLCGYFHTTKEFWLDINANYYRAIPKWQKNNKNPAHHGIRDGDFYICYSSHSDSYLVIKQNEDEEFPIISTHFIKLPPTNYWAQGYKAAAPKENELAVVYHSKEKMFLARYKHEGEWDRIPDSVGVINGWLPIPAITPDVDDKFVMDGFIDFLRSENDGGF